jgi:tripartite-type tricarboxylate transporter receptor subunit TctC
MRFTFSRTMLAAATLLGATLAHAAYPDRNITLVVTYPPGGTADRVARLIAPELSKELGQNVIVDNRGGAGGMIGAAYVAKAAPDGYTIMLDAANHTQNPALRKMQFDTLKQVPWRPSHASGARARNPGSTPLAAGAVRGAVRVL